MSKHGVNVPKGIAVASVEEVRKAIKDTFAGQDEVISADFIALELIVDFGTYCVVCLDMFMQSYCYFGLLGWKLVLSNLGIHLVVL